MGKRKEANLQVKDRLFQALLELAQEKDLSQVKVAELRGTLRRGARVVLPQASAAWRALSTTASGAWRASTTKACPSAPRRAADRPCSTSSASSRDHADAVLAFHRAHAAITLLDVVTDCEIAAHGDMPAASLERYQLYFYAGAFYNMLVCWLESGLHETPEALADEFLRLSACPPGGAQRTGAEGSRQAQAGGPAGGPPDFEYQTGAGDPRGPAQS